MPLRRWYGLTLTLAGLATIMLGAQPASAGTAPRPASDRPSVMQAEDLAHRHDALSLPAASPYRVAPPRAAASAATTSTGPYNNAGLQREVFGFAPYWSLASGTLSDVRWDRVSTVSYFGLTVNSAGGFDNDAGMTGWNSAALSSMISAARSQGDRAVVTVKSFDDASINPVVSNPTVGQVAINNIISAVGSRGLDGVNVDFEGTTNSSYPNIQADFTAWVASLSRQLHAARPGSQLTLDAYSGSASWDGGFMRIDTLAPSVDAFFIMAYDMTAPNDLPNAPLAGPYTYTDTSSVTQFLAKVGGNGAKVILGVPYYGYKFSTQGAGFNAPTQGGPSVDTYSDALSDFACAPQLQQNWDAPSSTPWASWWSPASGDPCGGNHGSWRQLYFDNAMSLEAKYNLVVQKNIRGAGMWALGYDHGSADLWNAITASFIGPPGSWSPWNSLAGSQNGDPAVVSHPDGRLEVFVLGGNRAIWHRWQNSPNGDWSGWYSLGGVSFSNPTTVRNADGRLQVFAIGSDTATWTTAEASPGGPWYGWRSLGGNHSGPPVAALNADGRLDVYVLGGNRAIWHSTQATPGSPSWSLWYSIGGVSYSDPAVGRNADGRLDVVAVGSDTGMWHIPQSVPGGAFTAWASIAGWHSGAPVVSTMADGSLEVFAVGSDAGVWREAEGGPNGAYGGWYSLGGHASGLPAVGRNRDGRLQLFAVGPDTSMWQVAERTPGGAWSGWSSIGGYRSGRPVVANQADGRLDVSVVGNDTAIWHATQLVPGG